MKLKFIFSFAVFLFLAVHVTNGQPGGGGPGGGGDPDAPITGIEILIATGGLLGVRKLLSTKKTK